MVNDITVSQRSALARAVNNPSLLPLLIQKISGLEWFDALENEGLLKPENIPKPIQAEQENYFRVPPWVVAEYLVTSSELVVKEESLIYANKYLKVIRDGTRYAKEKDFGNYRTWWQFAKILNNLPSQIISVSDIELIEFWLSDKFESGIILDELSTWILRLLNMSDAHSTSLVFALINKIYTCTYREKKFGSKGSVEAVFKYRSYSFKKFIEKTSLLIGQNIGLDAVELLRQRFEDIIKQQKEDSYSTIWRPAIEEHEQNMSGDDSNDLVLIGFRDMLKGFSIADPKAAEPYLVSLLGGELITTKRVAIFVLGEQFDAWKSETIALLLNVDFFCYQYQHELWNFLAQNFDKFDKKEKQKTFEVIDQIVVKDVSTPQVEQATAYRKQIWLAAVKDKDQYALKKYQELFSITNTEQEHPDFSSYMQAINVTHTSEISASEMAMMEVSVLVKTLQDYEIPSHRFDGPDLEGLAKEFRSFVYANPVKVIDQIDNFKDLNLAFVYELLEAYQELWNKQQDTQLDWNKIWHRLVRFCSDLVANEYFWNPENSKEKNSFVGNRHWVVGSIARLIESGCQKIDYTFNLDLVESARRLLQTLLNKQEGNEFNEKSDAVFVAINSPRGKCVQALINLALYSCRESNKSIGNHENAWKIFSPMFDQELKQANLGKYEFATLATNHLPNFNYLSNNWVLANLSAIFYPENRLAWLCAMKGYSYLNTLNRDVYNYLKKQGLYLKALDEESLKDRVKDRLIQFIVISFIWDDESLDQQESLIKNILDRNRPEELQQLIWFIWTLRKEDDVEGTLNAKIFKLWPALLEKIDFETNAGKKLASKLCNWSAFVTDLNGEQFEWLKKSVPFANVDHNGYELIENLAKLSERFPMEVGRLLLEMIVSSPYDDPEDALESIFRNMCAIGADGKAMAKQIASDYLNIGFQKPMNLFRKIDV